MLFVGHHLYSNQNFYRKLPVTRGMWVIIVQANDEMGSHGPTKQLIIRPCISCTSVKVMQLLLNCMYAWLSTCFTIQYKLGIIMCCNIILSLVRLDSTYNKIIATYMTLCRMHECFDIYHNTLVKTLHYSTFKFQVLNNRTIQSINMYASQCYKLNTIYSSCYAEIQNKYFQFRHFTVGKIVNYKRALRNQMFVCMSKLQLHKLPTRKKSSARNQKSDKLQTQLVSSESVLKRKVHVAAIYRSCFLITHTHTHTHY